MVVVTRVVATSAASQLDSFFSYIVYILDGLIRSTKASLYVPYGLGDVAPRNLF